MPTLKPVAESPRILRTSSQSSRGIWHRTICISGKHAYTNNPHPLNHLLLQIITPNPLRVPNVNYRSFTTASTHLSPFVQQQHPSSRFPINPSSTSTSISDNTAVAVNPIRYNGVYVAVFKPARRAFHTTPVTQKDHHFDTHKIVQRLQNEGFSEEQAVALMGVLNDVVEESIQNLTRTTVLKEDAERSTYTQKVDFAKLRSELLNSDSTEAQLTRSSHDRIAGDLAKLNSRLRDEINRTQASVRLDLNLEKGRIREEANSQEMRIKETETRIEQEVAGLRERIQAVKFSTLQWLMGVCTGTAALILGAWRLLM